MWFYVGCGVTVASFAYLHLVQSHDWAGNLGYTDKEKADQKKKKEQEEQGDEH